VETKSAKKRKEILERAALYDDAVREGRPGKGPRSGKSAAKKYKKTEITTPKAIKRRLKISEAITVGELAKRFGVKSNELMKN
jgi:translation initiation factor IF-2